MKRRVKNPVAKNMNKFNKASVHRDRKNDYKRKKKFKEKIELEDEEIEKEFRHKIAED
jgi:hypothetical protein